MSNRRFESQFSYSFERQPVRFMGAFTQSGSTGTFATLTSQGVTYTANTMGTGGNSITITITGGGTAGAEVVTVVGNAISVQIQSGVSTVTQVRTAVNASTAAAALVTASGTSSSTVATHAAQNLATGTNTAFTFAAKNMTLTQTGTGIFKVSVPGQGGGYAALLGFEAKLGRSTVAQLNSQVQSASVTGSSPSVSFFMQSAGTATNLSSGDTLYIVMELRNSGTNTN